MRWLWLFFAAAAILEVGGDATIRQGLRWRSVAVVAMGMVALAAYGFVVNKVKWEFSKLLGVYIAFFALASVLFGRVALQEKVPWATWVGLGLIVGGGMVIQFGGAWAR